MQELKDLMRKLLRKIITIPETAAFFEAFTAKSPNGQPRGCLLMSNALRTTKEKLKPMMVALNAAFRAMYRGTDTGDVWPCDWAPLISKSLGQKKTSSMNKRELRHKRSKKNREKANVEVIHDTATQSRHAIIQ